MTKKLEKFNKIARLPVNYLESLPPKFQMQLPFIFYGNLIFFFAFICLGGIILATSTTHSQYFMVGILALISSILFLGAVILIKNKKLMTGVYLSTVGLLLASIIIVVVTPPSTNPLCFYRSGCFLAVMTICNHVVALNKKQIYLFFLSSIIIYISGCVVYWGKTAQDFSGTISAIGVNGFALLISNFSIVMLYKYNEEILRVALDSQKKASDSLTSITSVLEESKNGLDVGQKLYEETHRVNTSILELNSIHTGITKESEGLFNNTTTISNSSSQMKNQAVQMKQSVKEQNKSIDETSHALTEISSTLSKLSNIAKQRDANMKSMVENLDSEKKLIHTIVEKVNLVKESSDNIAGFVKTVNSIAQRTGILAMNASIESTHAGEQGKGFSVISQEIRKLSEQTKINAQQITDKLESNTDIVLSTTELVNNFDVYINRTTEEMRSTIEMLEQLLSGIQEIDRESEKVMDLLSFVVNKSKDTGAMVDSVVHEIDIQDNSLSEITSIAQGLADSVNGMKNQLKEIHTAVEKIETEAQSNIQVTERITAALTE